jgi:hypothetical protein
MRCRKRANAERFRGNKRLNEVRQTLHKSEEWFKMRVTVPFLPSEVPVFFLYNFLQYFLSMI